MCIQHLLKIPNRLGKMSVAYSVSQKIPMGDFLTQTVGYRLIYY